MKKLGSLFNDSIIIASRLNLSGANLSFSNLEDADQSDADLTGTNLQNVNINASKLCRTITPWGEDNSGC
jgi:uncharacterized protein YjbI with pentapeptide repeats